MKVIEQPYNYQSRIQGDVGWDRKKLPEPNLHVYSKDDTEIMVYSMRRWSRKRDLKRLEKKTRELVTEERTLCS